MRSNRHLAIPTLLGLAIVASTVHAQQPPRQPRTRAAARPGGELGETDLLRPYGSRAEGRGFTPEPLPTRRSLDRTAYEAPRRNYFPGLRAGQGPNPNVVGPLCVPGRRAFLSVQARSR